MNKKQMTAALTTAIIALGVPGAYGARTKPDLIESSLANPPATRPAGGTFKVTDKVKNIGTRKAGKSVTRYFLSLDKKRNAGDVQLVGQRSVKALNPNKTSKGSKTVTIPASTPLGAYWLIACADATKKVTERSERNNCRRSTRQLTIPDSTAPAAPVITGFTPSSPTNSGGTDVQGDAEPNSTVHVFKNANCDGTEAASGTADSNGDFAIAVTVEENSTTDFSATATDAAGNTSPCSNSLSFTEDSTAPDPPELTASTPTSPSNDPSPNLSGAAESGTTVTVYESTDCSGPPENTGSAADFGTTGISVDAPADATTSYSATATDEANNVSACSSPLNYRHDSLWETEPNNDFSSAETLTAAAPERKGSIDPGSEADFFSFTVAPGSAVSLQTFNASGTTCGPGDLPEEDTVLTLYAADGTTILQQDDDSGPGFCSLLNRSNLSGKYYVRVTKSGGGAVAIPEYWLKMAITPPPAETEPNNTFGQASVIPGQFAAGSISPIGDLDYYSITVPQGGFIQARTFDTTGFSCQGVDTTLRLFAPDGTTELGSNDNDADPNSCSTIDGSFAGSSAFARHLAAGTYYIRVEETGNDSTTDYHLSKLSGALPQEVEPNDSAAQAGIFSAADLKTGVVASINPVGDLDFYALHVPAGADLIIETFDDGGQACGGIDTVVRLWGPNGTPQLGEDDDLGPGLCSKIDGSPAGPNAFARNLAAGTYYVSVEDFANNHVINTYVLKFNVVLPSEVESNNSTADADARATDPQPVIVETDESFTGSISSVGDSDVFKLNLAAPSVVRFETFDSSARNCTGVTTTVALLDSAGVVLKTDSGSGIGGCAALIHEVPAGPSYIRVTENGNNALITSYVLEADVLTASTETEANDTKETANPISATGIVVSGDHENMDDPDFYSITVPTSGMSIRAETIEGNGNLVETCESEGLDSEIDLLNAAGTVIANNDDLGRGFCSLIDGTGSTPTLPGASNLAAGTYYLLVRQSDATDPPGGTFDYRLAVTIR